MQSVCKNSLMIHSLNFNDRIIKIQAFLDGSQHKKEKEDTGRVVYKSKMTHGKDKRNFLIVDAEEFIALITQHIPEKNFQLVRYYGFYSTGPGASGAKRRSGKQIMIPRQHLKK